MAEALRQGIPTVLLLLDADGSLMNSGRRPYGRLPERPQEDLGCWSALGLWAEEEGRGDLVSLKKPEVCSVRVLASLFLPPNEVFHVKNIAVGIVFLGQPFLICFKWKICCWRLLSAARRQRSLIWQYRSRGTQDKTINPCFKQLSVKACSPFTLWRATEQ